METKPKSEGRKPRYKLLLIDSNLILEMISGLHKNNHIRLPKIDDLPDGCEVLAVQYNYQYNAFEFKLYHESFEPVPPHAMIPRIGFGEGITYEVFDLEKLRQENESRTD